jgi:hypothetical protein
MNKKTIIITGVTLFAVVILLSVGYFFLNQNKPTSTEQPVQTKIDSIISTQEPISTTNPSSQIPTDSKIKISLNNTSVSVNNFYKDPETKVFDPERDAVIKDEPTYTILYYTMDQSFFIGLLGGDLQVARNTGEQELLKKLGITKEQSCKLRVSVTVPASVNKTASGADYHLSFCPDGKPLP